MRRKQRSSPRRIASSSAKIATTRPALPSTRATPHCATTPRRSDPHSLPLCTTQQGRVNAGEGRREPEAGSGPARSQREDAPAAGHRERILLRCRLPPQGPQRPLPLSRAQDRRRQSQAQAQRPQGAPARPRPPPQDDDDVRVHGDDREPLPQPRLRARRPGPVPGAEGNAWPPGGLRNARPRPPLAAPLQEHDHRPSACRKPAFHHLPFSGRMWERCWRWWCRAGR